MNKTNPTASATREAESMAINIEGIIERAFEQAFSPLSQKLEQKIEEGFRGFIEHGIQWEKKKPGFKKA